MLPRLPIRCKDTTPQKWSHGSNSWPKSKILEVTCKESPDILRIDSEQKDPAYSRPRECGPLLLIALGSFLQKLVRLVCIQLGAKPVKTQDRVTLGKLLDGLAVVGFGKTALSEGELELS